MSKLPNKMRSPGSRWMDQWMGADAGGGVHPASLDPWCFFKGAIGMLGVSKTLIGGDERRDVPQVSFDQHIFDTLYLFVASKVVGSRLSSKSCWKIFHE